RYVKVCRVCQKHQNSNRPEPLMWHEIPKNVFSKLGVDVFDFEGLQYFVAVDYKSRYMQIVHLPRVTSGVIINALKNLFSTLGIPQTLFTDNATYFVSEEMKKFAEQWDFNLQTSSPNYPQSNGKSERFVQTAKKFLKKCNEDKTD